MAARCRGQVHCVTRGSEAGRAVIAAAGGCRPIRGQCGTGCSARRDDQHIRPIAKVGDAVSAGTDDEAVGPRAASQRIIASAAIDCIVAGAAAEAIGAAGTGQAVIEGGAINIFYVKQRVGAIADSILRPGQGQINGDACASVEIGCQINACTAIDDIIAVATFERITGIAAQKTVIASIAVQAVIAVATINRIIALIAVYGVVTTGAGQAVIIR